MNFRVSRPHNRCKLFQMFLENIAFVLRTVWWGAEFTAANVHPQQYKILKMSRLIKADVAIWVQLMVCLSSFSLNTHHVHSCIWCFDGIIRRRNVLYIWFIVYYSNEHCVTKRNEVLNESSHLLRAAACAEGPSLSLAFVSFRSASFCFVSPKSVQCEPARCLLILTFPAAFSIMRDAFSADGGRTRHSPVKSKTWRRRCILTLYNRHGDKRFFFLLSVYILKRNVEWRLDVKLRLEKRLHIPQPPAPIHRFPSSSSQFVRVRRRNRLSFQ